MQLALWEGISLGNKGVSALWTKPCVEKADWSSMCISNGGVGVHEVNQRILFRRKEPPAADHCSGRHEPLAEAGGGRCGLAKAACIASVRRFVRRIPYLPVQLRGYPPACATSEVPPQEHMPAGCCLSALVDVF